METRIAVLVTCHNRARTTHNGIASVLASKLETGQELRIFAVDDGSTDDTLAVLNNFGSRVEVLHGNGSCYWAGGMRLAETAAATWNPDFYVWFNDDVLLNQNAILLAIDALRGSTLEPSAVVGSVTSVSDGTVIYGARSRRRERPLKFELVSTPDAIPAPVTFNGNFVVYSRITRSLVGRISAKYRHGYADYDYGLRIIRYGGHLVTLDRPVGTSSPNPRSNRMFDPNLRLNERLRVAISPFGLPPLEHFDFCREHVPEKSFYWFFRSYLRVFVPASRR